MVEVRRNIQRPSIGLEIVHEYPLAHWQELARFFEGEECDPKSLFRLADDRWDAWPYAKSGRPISAGVIPSRFRAEMAAF